MHINIETHFYKTQKSRKKHNFNIKNHYKTFFSINKYFSIMNNIDSQNNIYILSNRVIFVNTSTRNMGITKCIQSFLQILSCLLIKNRANYVNDEEHYIINACTLFVILKPRTVVCINILINLYIRKCSGEL